MKGFLSHYRPKYIRSLVYMLQLSEYNVNDFLHWYHRTWDFSNVEKRGSLKYTSKAILCTVVAWFFVLMFLSIIILGLSPASGDIPHLVGALLILVSPFLVPYLLAFCIRIINTLQIPVEARIVARAKRKLAAHKAFKVAIAGSYGKTSMRELLKTILSEGRKVAAPKGSHNTPLGIAQFIETLSGNEEVLIFELGEYYPGDIKKLCELVRPDLGIITGVNEAHLSKFKQVSAAADTIFELAGFVPASSLYINGENEIARSRAREGNVLYSRSGAGKVIVESVRTDLDGTSVFLKGAYDLSAKSKLLGVHQVGPIAAAVAIAAQLGLSSSEVLRGIEKTKPFEHRLQPTVVDGITTLDDSYNGNPDGVRAVIEFLKSLDGHRRWYVTPGLVEMGDRSEQIHKEIGGQLAKAGIENVVLIKNSVTPYIERGLEKAGYSGKILRFEDMPKALTALQHMTVPTDVVLIQNDWPDQYA
jgi:UDP-N-acetylmuramoyl-tripeptide--D-alanyl-D-alanine ligase